VVGFTPPPFLPPGKIPNLSLKSGWAAELLWIIWKIEKSFVFCVISKETRNASRDMN